MKMYLFFLSVMILSFFVFGFSQSALAQEELLWADCTIDKVMQTKDFPQARLTEVNGVFESKVFNITNENKNAQLAVILTAISLNKQIRIAFYDGTPANLILVAINND